MDYIFDRLGNLLKSLMNESETNPRGNGRSRSGDGDLDDAMDELDEFLNRGKRTESEARESSERLKREHEARNRAERGSSGPSASYSTSSGNRIPESLRADFANLEVPFGASFEEIRKNYKKLLKQHHPDRHSGDPEAVRKATTRSARINASYQRLETWHTTGKID